MKIALAQINPKVGDLHNNSKKIIQMLSQCHQDCDLVIFPELSLCGYPPKDLLLNRQFAAECWKYLTEYIAPSVKIPCLIGLPTVSDNNYQLYNSLAYINNGKLVHLIHKKLLPNYDVFNESRYFKSANICNEDDLVIDVRGKKVAVLICEDLLAIENKFALYSQSPVDWLATRRKIDLVVCSSASPFRIGHISRRLNFARIAQVKMQAPVALINQVGANDDLLFDGASFVLSNTGQLIKLANHFKEDLIMCDCSLTDSIIQTEYKNIIESSNSLFLAKEAIVMGIKDYFEKTGFQKAFIGLSGGVDSALVTCLAVEALGKDNVCAVMMPSNYSSKGSLSDSEQLVQNLNIQSRKINIQPIVQAFLSQSNLQTLTLAEENLQSRSRGTLLMGLANQENALVLATGNKSEFSVGYSTLYGDMCGALAPIGDLWKTQVWEMAKTFNTIPTEIIDKLPSAELRPNQLDTDSLPDYELLDEILITHIEKGASREKLLERGFPAEIVTKVLKLLATSEFKRKQAPIILKVSVQAFGSGWQFPVACSR